MIKDELKKVSFPSRNIQVSSKKPLKPTPIKKKKNSRLKNLFKDKKGLILSIIGHEVFKNPGFKL